MNHQSEIRALANHFHSRNLDEAEQISLLSCWLGVTVARHSNNSQELELKAANVAKWIRQNAEYIHVQLFKDRLQ